MENYYYLNEELTSYDKYILSKKNALKEDAVIPSFNQEINVKNRKQKSSEVNEREYSDYDKYLFAQLNRKGPSTERVLTKEEFYSNVNKEQTKSKSFGKLFNNVTFKKGGKIILAFYVIIMVVLASILIVANTSDIYTSDIANATETGVVENKGAVKSMTIEDNDSEQDNWIDRLCDAINK